MPEIPEDLKVLRVAGQEVFREYTWRDPATGVERCYRIDSPVEVYLRHGKDGSRGGTHRVLDAVGLVHCVPAVGMYGCVLRWRPKDPENPVKC